MENKKVQKIDSEWLKLLQGGFGLHEAHINIALKEIAEKINEICDILPAQNDSDLPAVKNFE